MKHGIEKFKTRVRSMFADEGLVNIKFFVRPGAPGSLSTFVREANGFQEAIDEGKYTEVNSIDGNLKRVRFDAPF